MSSLCYWFVEDVFVGFFSECFFVNDVDRCQLLSAKDNKNLKPVRDCENSKLWEILLHGGNYSWKNSLKLLEIEYTHGKSWKLAKIGKIF